MGKKPSEQIPLETVASLVISDGGERAIVTHRKRGFLRDIDVRKIQAQRQNGPAMPDGRTELTALTGKLRAHLDAAGLATDKWDVTPIELDFGYNPNEDGFPKDDDLWHDYNMEATEPLSQDQIAASLLHSANRLLRSLDHDQLSEVFRAMQLFHLSELAAGLNQTAVLGARATAGRTKGPEAKKAQGARMREIIKLAAEELWSEEPAFKNKRDQTAQKIFDAVNAATKAEKLRALAVKTIYNHLLDMSKNGV
jgi:hypothetical protein